MPSEVSIEVSILPKPLIISRSAGLYARFFVPADLKPMVGARYVFSTKASILELSKLLA